MKATTKNEDNHKNEDNSKNSDHSKNEENPKMRSISTMKTTINKSESHYTSERKQFLDAYASHATAMSLTHSLTQSLTHSHLASQIS